MQNGPSPHLDDPQFQSDIEQSVRQALQEDIRDGDITAMLIPEDNIATATVITREQAVICGQPWVDEVFKQLDPNVEIEWLVKDGDEIQPNQTLFNLKGSARSLLTGERTALNFLQTLSGTATTARQYAKLVEGTDIKILDTRKTTPGIRALEKWAVKIGGGENHRFALYDMIMLKDNHIDFCGGITKAIQTTQAYLDEKSLDLKIIVEARNLDEIAEILENKGVYRILIDNFNYEDTRKAVALIGNQCLTESSGGITLDTVREYAECGVDYISSGALTHSVHNLDLSLKAV